MKRWLTALREKTRKAYPNREELLDRFRLKYLNFKDLLGSNAELLGLISDLEVKLRGEEVFGASYILRQATRTVFHAGKMVESFDRLSSGRYPGLKPALARICEQIRREMERKKPATGSQWILPYERIHAGMVDQVGGKSANLGELKSRLRLPVPKGFAITTAAFETVAEANDLIEKIRKEKMELLAVDPESIQVVSRRIQNLFLNAEIPPALDRAILDAHRETFGIDTGGAPPVAVAMRSSAIGEDSQRSFAGQYHTELNVAPDKLLWSYKRVLASLFSPRAIAYRLQMGLQADDIAMGVACLQMVPAAAAGVVYTRDPLRFDEDTITIHALWGLGTAVVDGKAAPDIYTVSKENPPRILQTRISCKFTQCVGASAGDIEEREVRAELRDQPCLRGDQVRELADLALRIDRHYAHPQDIEWALDADGRFFILQARPLRGAWMSATGLQELPAVSGHALLLEGGDVACPGIGCGPACRVHTDADLAAFPDGGVLVAVHASPRFVVIMDRARAILTDSGSVSGHMASLAREFNIPAILNTRTATADIPAGAQITVDAYSARVYEGTVAALTSLQTGRVARMKGTPVYRALRRMADLIVPLNLTDPRAANFTASGCRTLHDIMRLVHEHSYTEMFQLSDMASSHGRLAVQLTAPIPIDLHVIDLGGGLSGVKERTRRVTPEQVTSAPFRALLRGMLREDLRQTEPRPVNLRGLMSVMSRQMLSPPQMGAERFGDRSYAIVSERYLNFSSRVGYHYSVLDAYCGKTEVKNYINFEFKGGAADDARRNRRARLIQGVLQQLHFDVAVNGDRVTARFAKHTAPEIEENIDFIGRLLQYTRQMDMLMDSERTVAVFTQCFLEGNYSMHCRLPERSGGS